MVTTDYTGVGKLQYLFGKEGYTILTSDYADRVSFTLLLPQSELAAAEKKITEATSGQAGMEQGDTCCYSTVDGEVLLFEE